MLPKEFKNSTGDYFRTDKNEFAVVYMVISKKDESYIVFENRGKLPTQSDMGIWAFKESTYPAAMNMFVELTERGEG